MKLWHSLTIEEVVKELKSNKTGLSIKEAETRLKQYGKNALPHHRHDHFIRILGRQFTDPIVILLVITVVFSFVIGEVIDAWAIIFIIVIDLIMGTFQEWKAGKNAESLANLIKVRVKVLRDNQEREIDSSELVLGDIVLLESGDKASADIRVISSNNLQVDESILTGESANVYKQNQLVDVKEPMVDRKNMVYAGTSIVTGRGLGIVVATALQTEIGKIADKVTTTKETKSPLAIRMEKFSKQISLLVVVVAMIIAALLLYKKVPGSEIFLSVIALSVSAMPEGLPLALTMALTIASNRMSKRNVIVKKLNAVESLGSCTVIASDKTGTLTVDEQTARKILLPDGMSFDVTGTGYQGKGEIIPQAGGDMKLAKQLSRLGMINNEAYLEYQNGKWQSYGDSIDIAFLALASKAKVKTSDIEIIGTIPYESEHKYSAVFYRWGHEIHCTVKGSIETVIAFTDTMRMFGKRKPVRADQLMKQNETLAEEGYRVIAIADGIIPDFKIKEYYEQGDIHDLTFEGMVAFIDPIREEAKTSIQMCDEAGIKVVMVTGDHPLTAFTIAKELNLATTYREVTTGEEVAHYLEQGPDIFDQFVQQKRVFTRVTPVEKLEIIESYKRQGEFIAVTGDGVNDAPAIRSANIGIAMGSGTDVAKDTAAMIIIDDNFKSIAAGIEEGRTAYSNIRKVSYMLLSCGLAEVLFFILAILFNLPMPLVAIQLLWLNIVTDGLQDFALSFEQTEPGIMKELPRSPQESIFNHELLSEVFIAGATIGLIVFVVWAYLINVIKMDPAVARGYMMVLMVFMQNMHVLNCRSEKRSITKISMRANPLIIISIVGSIILQFIVMEVPFLSAFLQTSTVPIIDMLKLFALSVTVLVVMELYKYIRYTRHKKSA